MRTLTEDEFRKEITQAIYNGNADMQTDNSGQYIVYSGWWAWGDGTFRDIPDPSYQDDITDA
jgi:hypothetical protein